MQDVPCLDEGNINALDLDGFILTDHNEVQRQFAEGGPKVHEIIDHHKDMGKHMVSEDAAAWLPGCQTGGPYTNNLLLQFLLFLLHHPLLLSMVCRKQNGTLTLTRPQTKALAPLALSLQKVRGLFPQWPLLLSF